MWFWTGEYELDFEKDDGYPIRIPTCETGRVDRVTEDTVWVVLDSAPEGKPVAVPRDEEWVGLNETDFLPSDEPNTITVRWYSDKQRRETRCVPRPGVLG